MKIDGRALDHSTLEQLRKRAARQIVDDGQDTETVASVLGMHLRTVQQWATDYRRGGDPALAAKPLFGRPRKLTNKQQEAIRKIVVGKNPMQLKFPFALWTRNMVQQVIKEKYGVTMALSSVGRMLHEMGLSVQKPKYQAWQQDSDAVRKWKEEEYPKIVKDAKKHGAEIFFEDEAGVRSDYHAGTTWAPKGQTPVILTTGARFSVNMISAISPRGTLRFVCTPGTVNAPVFIDFLKRMVHDSDRPVYLVVDGHPTHKAKMTREYVESTNGKLRLYFLPAYSPKLNPDESVWREVKTHGVGKTPITGPDHLRRFVLSKLHQLQKSPNLLKGLFKTPDLAYIPVE